MVAQHGLHPVLEGGEGLRDRLPQRQHDELDEVELELRLRRLRLPVQGIQAATLSNRGCTHTQLRLRRGELSAYCPLTGCSAYTHCLHEGRYRQRESTLLRQLPVKVRAIGVRVRVGR